MSVDTEPLMSDPSIVGLSPPRRVLRIGKAMESPCEDYTSQCVVWHYLDRAQQTIHFCVVIQIGQPTHFPLSL